MKITTTQVYAEALVVRERKLEIDRGSSKYELGLEGNDGLAAVLIEIVSGRVNISVERFNGHQLSNCPSVTLYAGCVADDLKSFAVRLASSGKATVRLTVALFRHPVNSVTKRMSSRACTVVCRFSLRAILAYQGICYLNTEAAVELPAVIDPGMESTMDWFNRPISEGILGVDPKNTIPVLVGGAIALGENCKRFFADGIYDSGHHPLGDLIERLGPQLISAMRSALESADWFYDSSDDLYSDTCRRLGCSEN